MTAATSDAPAGIDPAGASNSQVVVLRVHDNNYAVPIGRVQEIVRVPEITPLPEAPTGVEGIINLRGHVLPVIDLPSRLGFGPAEQDRAARVVVAKMTGGEKQDIGLLVDGVSKVLRLNPADVEPASDVAQNGHESLVHGVAKIDGHLVLLLDLDAALAVYQTAGLN